MKSICNYRKKEENITKVREAYAKRYSEKSQ